MAYDLVGDDIYSPNGAGPNQDFTKKRECKMKPIDRREQDRLRTRNAILDATEALMREEGYAAVTSRRIAERAGLKSQLVHYHFGTMDELFQEAFRRNEKLYFSKHMQVLRAKNPLDQMWNVEQSIEGMDLVGEYVAAANHRKVLQDELVQSWDRFSMLHATAVAKFYADNEIDPGPYSPEVITFLITAISKELIAQAQLDYTQHHREIINFMDGVIDSLSPRDQDPAHVRKRRKRSLSKAADADLPAE